MPGPRATSEGSSVEPAFHVKRSGWHHHNAAIGVFPFGFACEADFLNGVVDDLPFKGVHGGELDWLPA